MKQLALATVLAFVTVLTAPPLVNHAAAQGSQAPTQRSLQIPIAVENFTGTFNLTRFVNVNGVVNAVGTLTGTLTTPTGLVGIVRTLSIPLLSTPTASCDILHLELGPLDLDLLGLVVHLDRIVLDVDAQPGAGNLLGNLLCSVAGLLDNPSGLARVLNRILGIIGA